MPHLIVTPPALADLRRLAQFLKDKNPRAAERATFAIREQIRLLVSSPGLGRPVQDSTLRELIIPFADSGYVVLYEFDRAADQIRIAAVRHQREAGY